MIITPSNANPLRESNIVIRLRGDDNGMFLVIAIGFKLVMLSLEHLVCSIICFDFISPMALSSIPSFILLAFLLKLSYPNKSKYLSSLWVESIPFFWAGSFYLFT